MAATAAPSLDELRILFTGDWIHDDDRWETTPCYSVVLAFEIARRCETSQDFQLRRILYGDLSPDFIPADALQAIQLAAQRYRQHRDLQKAGRGL
jgi:hypothetical protein